MSLLDGNEDVVVQLMARGADADGNPAGVVVGEVAVRCAVQSTASAEDSSRGTEIDTTYKVIARSWPGDERSRVVWRGRTWDTVGEPLRYGRSRLTGHVTLTIGTTQPYRGV